MIRIQAIKTFLVDLIDFQLLEAHHVEIPSPTNSMIHFQYKFGLLFLSRFAVFFST